MVQTNLSTKKRMRNILFIIFWQDLTEKGEKTIEKQ